MNFEFQQKPIGLKTAFAAVILGVIIGFIMVISFGYDPFHVFGTLFRGAFGTPKSIVTSLRWATPLMFTGVAAALSFRGGMFNFGLDGQLYVGSLAATIVGVTCVNLPAMILIPVMMIVSMIFGAMWAFIPVFIKVRLGGSEIVPALMLNYVGIYITDYIVHYYFLASGTNGDSLKTERIAQQAQFPNLFKGYQLTGAILIGLAVILLFYLMMKKSKFGYNISMSGMNPEFARYGGINVDKTRILVMLISGALAGLGGAIEIMAMRWRFESGFAPSFGNDGILCALLGSSTPFGTLAGTLFMGALKAGSLAVERYTDISRALATVIQGTIICFISARLISKYVGLDKINEKLRKLFPNSRKDGDENA
ncbi:ABC transporter permease [Petroclostridium sp. X23]|uniref:ABC transporter permease n=1 Tax=Petroclostridium sp. X23 TaxID=3045146 RepID=UPI0024AE20BD|nr:ABC transporter permease [Petroclostridium sp. X23]WHH61235.1 ABC transporter permease [Petroclostridium sp. X23]